MNVFDFLKRPDYGAFSKEKLSYNDATKRVRRKLKDYSAESIVDCALNYINAKGREDNGLYKLPWVVLLVVKLVLEDHEIRLHSGKICTQEIFLDACNFLWNNSGKQIDASRSNRLLLSFRSLINVQLIFQRNDTWSFLRIPALIGLKNAEHPLSILFKEEFGLSPLQFNFYAFLFMAPLVIHGNNRYIKNSYFDYVRLKYNVELENFLTGYSKNLSELRDLLRNESEERIANFGKERSPVEFVETPWLMQYPFLKKEDYLFAWHPSLYAMSLEETVHKRLSKYGQRYTQLFSEVFEDYVLSLLKQLEYELIDEKEYKKKVQDKSVPAVDAFLKVNDEINLLIECKMSLFQDEILVSDDEKTVYYKFNNVRKAFVQGWKAGEIIRKNQQFHISKNSVDFLIVVVNRRLNCGSAAHFRTIMPDNIFQNIYPKNSIGQLHDTHLSNMPIENILIMSIDVFEQFVLAVSNKKLNIIEFFNKVAEMNSNPNIPYLNLDEVIFKDFGIKKRFEVELLTQERNKILEYGKELLLPKNKICSKDGLNSA